MGEMIDVAALVRESMLAYLEPPPRLSCADWADQFRQIAKGPERGPWRTDRTPYLREPMECTDPEHPAQKIVMQFATQLGKALALDTPIATPTGWTTIGDIQPGDTVFDENGAPCNVLLRSEVFTDHRCWRITFSDGVQMVADGGHRWTVDDERDPRSAVRVTLTTEQIAATFKNNGRNRYAIPVAGALQLPAVSLPVHPYCLGAWLGDGSSHSATITQHEDDVPHLLAQFKAAGHQMVESGRSGKTLMLTVDPKADPLADGVCPRGHVIADVGVYLLKAKHLGGARIPHCAECRRQYAMKSKYGRAMDAVVRSTFYGRLTQLGVLPGKHIPTSYLRASFEQRLALLQGLMDTDGTVCRKSGRVSISSSYPVLAAGIVELVRSLGFKPTIRIRKTSAKDAMEIGWAAYDDQPVFRLPRKLALQRPRESGRPTEAQRRRIVNVEPVQTVPVRCIAVDSPSHLFLAGREMVPTHNTEVLYNALFKRIHLQPVDMMMVQPTLNDAKDHSRQRFTPTVRVMPEIEVRLPAPRSRDEQNTWQTKEVRGGATLFFAGANSARSLASKPLGFVVCDEIDGYPHDVDGEGDPLTLVRERMSNFPTRKLLLCSTPTLKGYSRIEAEYLASDRRRYWVPCPHCGASQVLVWGNDKEHGIKWLKTPAGAPRADTAVYVCEHCSAAIEERHKPTMLHEGRWIADAPEANRGLVAGFHLSKLYSPLGWKSWPMIVDDWQAAQDAARAGDVSKLKTFINTSLAETWEEQGDKANEHELKRRAADIPMRIVQWGHYVLTLAVDVQPDRLHLGLWAWGRGLARQLVDRLVIYGDPSVPEDSQSTPQEEWRSPWTHLTAYRRTPVLHASGAEVPLLATLIDSGGHNTQAVYAYARTWAAEHVLAIKGASQASKPVIGKPSQVEVNWRGQKIKRGVKLWPIGTDTAKAEIYGRLRATQPGPGYVLLSKHMQADAFEQLASERLVTRYVKGRAKLEWVLPNGRRNEDLDCAVYALAGAHWMGANRWTDREWLKWQLRAEPEKPVESVPEVPVEVISEPEPETPEPPKTARRRRGRFSIGPSWGR